MSIALVPSVTTQPQESSLPYESQEDPQEIPPVHVSYQSFVLLSVRFKSVSLCQFVPSPVHVQTETNNEVTHQNAYDTEQHVASPSDTCILEFDDDAHEVRVSTDPQQQIEEPESTDPEAPRIPISHLNATNQYPSLTAVPQNIAKSFAPIYIQPQNQPPTTDIYNDYVNNPYNLVLQVDTPPAFSPTPENTPAAIPITSHFAAVGGGSAISNVFHASNYFADKSTAIPPGSEILFNGP